MKVLVTGAGGFVGRHLVPYLREAGHEVVPTTRRSACGGLHVDLRDPDGVRQLIVRASPDWVCHLAGMAFVPDAERDPGSAVADNCVATANLLRSLSELAPRCRLLLVSSGEVYGRRQGPEPIDETTPADPATVYSITKRAAEELALHFRQQRGLPVIVARPFNHCGPGQSAAFAIPSFARQIARIEAKEIPPVVEVGNLEAKRDFSDVRDVVAAYASLLEKGEPGEIYNVCSGDTWKIQELLERLITVARAEVEVRVDPSRMRPSDLPVFRGSAEKISRATGWTRRYTIDQSLADILDDWRARLREHDD